MSNKIWYTSDLHFHHKNIVKFTNRSKETTQEDHDEWLIDLFKGMIDETPTLSTYLHLNDVAKQIKLTQMMRELYNSL